MKCILKCDFDSVEILLYMSMYKPRNFGTSPEAKVMGVGLFYGSAYLSKNVGTFMLTEHKW